MNLHLKPVSPMFSIVIPVYNAEPFLSACLDSVLTQNYKSFEIVCIDDGSTDGSPALLDEYARSNSCVRVEHRANQGVSSARNRGIESAHGKYLLFLDADDYIAQGSLRHIRRVIAKHSPDIIVVGGASVPSSFWDVSMKTRDIVYDDDFIKAVLEEGGARPLIAGKVYRTAFLKSKGLLFDESLELGEDQAFQFATFPYANRIVFSDFECYYYRQRQGSAMSVFEEDRFSKVGLHLKLSRAILQGLSDGGVLADNSAALAKWFVDFTYFDIFALPDRQGVVARDGFVSIINDYFRDAMLDAETERMVAGVQGIRKDEDPIVSIVVPVHNSEEHLRQSFESVRRQTMRQFELIYVDDGSTDSTREILSGFETLDTRVRVEFRDHCGAGAALNEGIALARGAYLLLMDASDLPDPVMLETMLRNAEKHDSDICVCRGRAFDEKTGQYASLPATCNLSFSEYCQPFSVNTEREAIFCFTSPDPWNKLFKTSFVRERGLGFQNLPNSNEICFTMLALVFADRVSAMECELISCRKDEFGYLQGSRYEHPLAFFDALMLLKESLIEAGMYGELERSFINFALQQCAFHLRICARDPKGAVAFETAYSFLRSEGLSKLGILGKDETAFYAYSGDGYSFLSDLISSESIIDFAKARALFPFDKIKEKDEEIARLREEVDELYSSYSFRLGSALLTLPRKVRNALSR